MSRLGPLDRVSRAARLVAILAATALALGACGKNPTKPKTSGDIGPHYLNPISPQNVLQNLVAAYNYRDSVETALVYDVAYQGSSTDPSQPTPVYGFTRADEVRHVHRLKNDPNIVSVELDLGQPGTWQLLPGLVSDPPGAMIIPIQYAAISLRDISASSYTIKPVTMEYAFRPNAVAPGDTVWTVIRWTETAN